MIILNILIDLNYLLNFYVKEELCLENFDFYGCFFDVIYVKMYKYNGKKLCFFVMLVRLIYNVKICKFVFCFYILLFDLVS